MENRVDEKQRAPKVRVVDYEACADRIRNIRDDVFIGEQGVPQELEYDGLDKIKEAHHGACE